jgi:hypothetical protein
MANDWPIGRIQTEADMDRQAMPAKSVESDPSRTLAAKFAVTRNTVLLVW